MTLAELDALKEQSLAELRAAADTTGLEQVRIRYLGRNGQIPAMMKQLKDVPPADRP